MVERMFKKGLVFGIIVLFIGVSVAPSINANIDRLPSKSKLVETSIRIHRASSIIPYKVKLTEKESDKIDSIFGNLKVSLDSAVTDEEFDDIYDGAVESLYELGMFPRHMSIRDVEQLVSGKCQKSNVKSSTAILGTVGENFNCKIAGQTTLTYMYDLTRPLLIIILELNRIMSWQTNLFYYNGGIRKISFGYYEKPAYFTYPSEGWVWTNGTNGVVRWDGEIIGELGAELVDYDYMDEIFYYAFMGVKNFKGVFIDRWGESPCYLGNAEHVKLS